MLCSALRLACARSDVLASATLRSGSFMPDPGLVLVHAPVRTPSPYRTIITTASCALAPVNGASLPVNGAVPAATRLPRTPVSVLEPDSACFTTYQLNRPGSTA